MYCTNCGKQIDSVSYACMYCGALVNGENEKKKKPKKAKSGKSIASLVLGILAFFFSIMSLVVTIVSLKHINGSEDWYILAELGKMFFAFIIVFIPIVLASIGFGMGLLDRGENKNALNAWGIWLSVISIVMSIVQIVLVMVQ